MSRISESIAQPSQETGTLPHAHKTGCGLSEKFSRALSTEDLVFPSEEARCLFEEEDRALVLRGVKTLSIFIMVLMPLSGVLDFFVYPHYAGVFMALRLLCSLLVAIVLWSTGTDLARQHYRGYSVLVPMIPAVFFAIMIAWAKDAGSPYYAGLSLCLVAIGFMFHWTYIEALLATGFVLAMYATSAVPVLMASQASKPILAPVINNLLFIVLNGAIVASGCFYHHKIRLREFLARMQLDQNRRELEVSNQQLRQIDLLKNDFLANVSHELRTPLTLLLAPLQSLRRQGVLPGNQGRMVENMHLQALRLLKLINDLLDIAKLQSGRLHLAYEALNTRDFLRHLVDSVTPLAQHRNILVTREIDPDLASAVEVDRDKLEKICLNLLFNAIKFTPDYGKIRLSAYSDVTDLTIQISDTGVGIAPERLPYIFDRFWQGDGSSKRKHAGTGIGLALVKELAEAHGGSIMASSVPNQGTTMTLKVPLSGQANRRQRDETTRKNLTPKALANPSGAEMMNVDWLAALYREAEFSPSQTARVMIEKREASNDLIPIGIARSENARPLILVADDEPGMRQFLMGELGPACDMVEALDGKDAVDKTRELLPDLLLLDYMMPELDGFEVCRVLRADARARMTPIMLLTAKADEETRLKGLEAGANDVLVKPFSLVEFQTRVRNLLRSHRLQRDLETQKSRLEDAVRQLRETEGQLVQSEKLASLGQLSAGIIHEINNPLNFANSALFLLSKRLRELPGSMSEGHAEILRDIKDGLQRVAAIVSDLRDFSHPDTGRRVAVNVSEVATTARRLLAKRLRGENIRLEQDIPDDLHVLANKNRLVQVMINLLQNACDALAGRALKVIELRAWPCDQQMAAISIRDNGCGIPKEAMGKLFDPFFTTKEVGKGTGLGLSICYRLIAEHGGTITVDSTVNRYTQFTVRLPKAEPHSAEMEMIPMEEATHS